jgi:acylphosphatase
MKHLSIRVYGKVQGVFFRAATRDVAEALNLTGFVRNEPDGSVYLEAEGADDCLQKLLVWCSQGPPRAVVTKVTSTEGPVKNFSSFSITR